LNGDPKQAYAVKVFRAKDAVSEPDARKRHFMNLDLAEEVKKEYELQKRCHCEFVAQVFALAQN